MGVKKASSPQPAVQAPPRSSSVRSSSPSAGTTKALTREDCEIFMRNPTINPHTGRDISSSGALAKKFKAECVKMGVTRIAADVVAQAQKRAKKPAKKIAVKDPFDMTPMTDKEVNRMYNKMFDTFQVVRYEVGNDNDEVMRRVSNGRIYRLTTDLAEKLKGQPLCLILQWGWQNYPDANMPPHEVVTIDRLDRAENYIITARELSRVPALKMVNGEVAIWEAPKTELVPAYVYLK